MICFNCGGPWSATTGHVFKSGAHYCGRCKRKVFGAFDLPGPVPEKKYKEELTAAG